MIFNRLFLLAEEGVRAEAGGPTRGDGGLAQKGGSGDGEQWTGYKDESSK